MKKMYSYALLAVLCACSSEDAITTTANEATVAEASERSLRTAVLNDTFNRITVGSNQALTCISFADEKNGVIFGFLGEGLITDDAGTTWRHFDTPRDVVTYSSAFMYDTRNIYAGRTAFYKANGNTMERVGNLGNYSGTTRGMHFFTDVNGIMVKESNVITTNDGGENWTVSLGGASYISDLEVVNENAMFAYGGTTREAVTGGVFYTTLDGGLTWTNMNYNGAEIMAADFVDEKVGYIADATNKVFKTTNSGATWTQLGIIPSSGITNISSLLYVSNTQLYATGYNGNLYKSADNGVTWTVHSTYQDGLNEIYRIGNSLYVIGDHGLVLKN